MLAMCLAQPNQKTPQDKFRKSMRNLKSIAACALIFWSGTTFCQNTAGQVTQNILQLSANGQVEVQQDLLLLSMTTNREGADANTVQTQLKTALDTALTEAKKTAQEGQMNVRTGNFSLSPRYGRDGKTTGWVGSAELVLEGRDFARVTAAAGKIQTMVVSNVQFGLSHEQRAKVEAQAQTLAIDRFKAKAAEIAKNFGFASYNLREVAVNNNDWASPHQPNTMRGSPSSMLSTSSPLPVEAGQTSVQITVSGSVQMK